MRDNTSCPERALLEAFVFNRLPQEQSRTVEDHLKDCETCLSTLETACRLESVLEALRHRPSREENCEESVVSELIERGRRLHTSATTVTPPPAAGAAVPTPHEEHAGVHEAVTATPALKPSSVMGGKKFAYYLWSNTLIRSHRRH